MNGFTFIFYISSICIGFVTLLNVVKFENSVTVIVIKLFTSDGIKNFRLFDLLARCNNVKILSKRFR